MQKGVVWPSPRFAAVSSGTGTVVTDSLTGLMWEADAGTPAFSSCTGGAKTWQAALDRMTCLNAGNYLGHNDWRLPNIRELRSLVNYGQDNTATWLNTQGFINVIPTTYWASTTNAGGTSMAWYVSMYNGSTSADTKTASYRVLAVRTGQDVATAEVAATGQLISYGTGPTDDGALRKGAAWPNPRFTVASSGTGTFAGTVVTDNLTGLMWAGDAGIPTFGSCTGSYKLWQGALDYVACLNAGNYLGHNDWRLPNLNELESLVNYERDSMSSWLNTQGFSNARNAYYWSSTTICPTCSLTIAWYVSMWSGNIYYTYKETDSRSVWPVRAGR